MASLTDRRLTDAEVWTIINALRAAAKVYSDEARAQRVGAEPSLYVRVVRQFRDQATLALALAEEFENE